jgi:hypothetical protein
MSPELEPLVVEPLLVGQAVVDEQDDVVREVHLGGDSVQQPLSRREARLSASSGPSVRDRLDRVAGVLLVTAAVSVVLGGIALAAGFPRQHTLLVYAAVALGALGVVCALPRALSSIPFDPSHPSPRRRSDDH